jgi:hypothetical protein
MWVAVNHLCCDSFKYITFNLHSFIHVIIMSNLVTVPLSHRRLNLVAKHTHIDVTYPLTLFFLLKYQRRLNLVQMVAFNRPSCIILWAYFFSAFIYPQRWPSLNFIMVYILPAFYVMFNDCLLSAVLHRSNP